MSRRSQYEAAKTDVKAPLLDYAPVPCLLAESAKLEEILASLEPEERLGYLQQQAQILAKRQDQLWDQHHAEIRTYGECSSVALGIEAERRRVSQQLTKVFGATVEECHLREQACLQAFTVSPRPSETPPSLKYVAALSVLSSSLIFKKADTTNLCR